MKFKESNNNPLFYLFQEAISNSFHFHFPFDWNGGEWEIADSHSQFVMRISANVFMSCAIVLIFFYFASEYSFFWGLYSLLLCLATPIVWLYWAEARPYSLWFLLTTIQSIIILSIIQKKEIRAAWWGGLFATNLLLSLTLILSFPQIVIAGFLLWFCFRGRFDKQVVFVSLPAVVCLFYYFFSPTALMRYQLRDSLELIMVSLPSERIVLMGLFLVFSLLFYLAKRDRTEKLEGVTIKQSELGYLAFGVLMFISALMILAVLKLLSFSSEAVVFVSNRYFVFLAPIGIILTTIISFRLIQFLKGKTWTLINLSLILAGLLVLRSLETYWIILHSRIY